MELTCISTTYNDGLRLHSALNSILNQTFENFEYLIVDDGSSPETLEVLSTVTDPRVTVIRQANDGLSSARNRAIDHAKGKYVCFLDADDSRPNWALQSISDAIRERDPDILLCPGILTDRRHEVSPFYDDKYFQLLRKLCPEGIERREASSNPWAFAIAQLIEPQSANKVVRLEFLKSTGIRFPNSHFFEDIFFHTSALAVSERIAFLDSPSFSYFRRYGRNQITAKTDDRRLDILAVSKMTLESFSRTKAFQDIRLRFCVLASCMRLVRWCEASISHHHKFAFRSATQGMLRMIDQSYFDFPKDVPLEILEVLPMASYAEELRFAA